MRRTLLTLLAGDGVLLLLTLIVGDLRVIASAQVGYWSSALVVLASFGTYRRMVQRRLEAESIPAADIDRDVIDRLEDPYDLYSEEAEETTEEKSAREQIREEKKRLKKQRRSPAAAARDAVPAFSPWRLGAYGVLVAGFFFLNGAHLLHLGSYLLSLALPIILAVWSLMNPGSENA
ncbi:hypothetical protein [Nitratifractor salsuginis]|uniref:Uncharacterized protein n=1 Tax=Nitratifractor salsuginis (strain DSM 16511 / JCM 12458 / E9I37-1) TaxID=749222 RepID=E6X278_NITSE|nr:hypothetical protein [Nitratifractor salsuginis]ADV46013.1 hypothetical protein Nitsa_0746 [Nitratifractor salsuginis DSM 16511]